MPDINLSQKTNLLEQDPYSYELQDVKKPALFHEMFPYNETPKIAFNYRRVPQNMPDDIFITTRHSAMASSRVLRIRRSR